MESGSRSPVESRGKAPGGDLGSFPPEAEDIYVKMCHSFKNLHSLPARLCSIRNGRKINLEAEKWQGKQQCLPIGYKKWAGSDRPPCPIGSAPNGSSVVTCWLLAMKMIALMLHRVDEKVTLQKLSLITPANYCVYCYSILHHSVSVYFPQACQFFFCQSNVTCLFSNIYLFNTEY